MKDSLFHVLHAVCRHSDAIVKEFRHSPSIEVTETSICLIGPPLLRVLGIEEYFLGASLSWLSGV